MIISIVGPTGVGKTKLSIALAKKYNAQIISCDSMQIYKKMDIGTAKIKTSEMEDIKHHMIDIKNMDEDYSVFEYQKDARNILDKLIRNGTNVIIVGGTGLYLNALLYDYKFKKQNKKQDFSIYTNAELFEQVKKIDFNTKIHPNNRQRLESFLINHDTASPKNDLRMIYNSVVVGLTMPRNQLYDAINKRVDDMFLSGLLEEARGFFDAKINSKAIKTAIGYKELYMYFNNEISLEEAKNLIKKRSRNYAKRQYTWFNNKMNVKWFKTDVLNFENTINEVVDYIKKVPNL